MRTAEGVAELPALGKGTLAAQARAIYLQRASGVLEVGHSGGTENLFFRLGELYLDRDHEAAVRISPVINGLPESARPAADGTLRRETEELAQSFARYLGASVEFKSDQSMVVELTGPLPTVCFLQELAVVGLEEDDLVAQLGGSDTKLFNNNETPALQQLPGLDPDMAEAMVSLEKPTSITDLLRGAGSKRRRILEGTTRLWSVGLVFAEERNGGQQEVLSPKMVRTFIDRIAADLDRDPLILSTEEHRTMLANLLGRLGELDHYALLEIDPRAGTDIVSAAYHHLARKVHPSHAKHLGLQGKEEAVQVLFERATEAYLILSDPRRRASYNTVAGIQTGPAVGAEQRLGEKRDLARQHYKRAAICLSEMDYSLAVDLLREAARMDPQPEYFAQLGVAQSKNPHWRNQALRSFEKALEMDPKNVAIRVAYGVLLEKVGRPDDAKEQYGQALEEMPDHVAARDALERLGGGAGVSTGGGFRSLFKATHEET
jgi:curved DNA-binding protein CbpA